jgi:hypothetical protein
VQQQQQPQQQVQEPHGEQQQQQEQFICFLMSEQDPDVCANCSQAASEHDYALNGRCYQQPAKAPPAAMEQQAEEQHAGGASTTQATDASAAGPGKQQGGEGEAAANGRKKVRAVRGQGTGAWDKEAEHYGGTRRLSIMQHLCLLLPTARCRAASQQ